ncbi:response regulator [Flavobacterium sp. 3HN19-14]|uniref:response regulator n=1 Tax=Flavobacterium sp. 3HN19-14 TaxID=3448133 RepID=UPI003EE2BBC3
MNTHYEPVNILLADDDSDDRFFFSTALDEMALQSYLTLMPDGIALMDYLKRDDVPVTGILFLDMNMPRKSGKECLSEIRNNLRFDDMCIVIYSTFDTEEQINEIMEAGANIYFNKPDELDKIKVMIQKAIEIYHSHPHGNTEETFVLTA